MSTLKRFCNKEIGENIWQPRSYDHIIRSKEDLEEHLRYIAENPLKWQYDELYSDQTR
jgi:REP element-mobilizing transposase RayT